MEPLVYGKDFATASEKFPKPLATRHDRTASTNAGRCARARSSTVTGSGAVTLNGIPSLRHDASAAAGFAALGEKLSVCATINGEKKTGMRSSLARADAPGDG